MGNIGNELTSHVAIYLLRSKDKDVGADERSPQQIMCEIDKDVDKD